MFRLLLTILLYESICARNARAHSTRRLEPYFILPSIAIKMVPCNNDFNHQLVSHFSREYSRGEVHVNNCECETNLFKLRLAKHMGVNKFNLQQYARTFQFLYNIRHLNRYEKFMKVLSVLIIATTLYIISEEILC
ncbi:MAG: hypothetical protein QXU32_06090 [Nitrososphaerales archaeon]